MPPSPDGCEFKTSELLTAKTHKTVQKKVLASFLAGQEVKILIGTQLLGEGVDLPSADALVYAHGKSAKVSLIQNIYRVGTAVEGKDHAIVVDFADRHCAGLLKHSVTRAETYQAEETMTVSVLDDASEFPAWVSRISG
jgi:superfamily II DNA or RNA helicase